MCALKIPIPSIPIAGFASFPTTKEGMTGNWVLDQIMTAITTAVQAFFGKVQAIKTAIESGDFTGAIIQVLEIAIPAFLLFVSVDLLCVKVLGSGLDLTGLKTILSQFFKVELIVSALIGAWVGAGIKSPAEQICNKLFRPSILSVAPATQLRLRNKITETRWKDILARFGVPDGDMKYILDMADQKPAMVTALRMYQFIDIPDEALKWLMTENDITMAQVQTLWLRYFHANRLRDEFMLYKNYLISAYNDGLLTDKQFKDTLALFKASNEEITQTFLDVQSQFNWNLTRSEVETLVWYYRKGVYGEDDPEGQLYDALTTIPINTATANAIVRLEASKKGVVWENP